MRNSINILFIFVLLVFSSCTTHSPPPLPGIPDWDYERDEIGRTAISNRKETTTQKMAGKIAVTIGGLFGGVVKSEIEIAPNVLFRTIEATLTKKTLRENEASEQPLGRAAASRWGISESNEGQITTDWKATSGRTVGLFWWKKEYQTEVRHIITIKRSYKSQNHSNFSIDTEVRERPNSNYIWAKGNPEFGRSSFNEIKKALLDAVKE